MNATLIHLGIALAVAAAVGAAGLLVGSLATSPLDYLIRYQRRWRDEVKQLRLGEGYVYLPVAQVVSLLLSIALLVITAHPLFAALAALIVVLPMIALHRFRRARLASVEAELDTFLNSLADAMSAIPNLKEAIASLHEHLHPPIKDEVGQLLAEIRLGSTIDEGLRRMASRIGLPGLDAAVEAALLSHRVGGDLSRTLRRIAENIREMARLEGVVKTKTAEGRTQAWVMGAVPPGMILLLEKMDPEWLSPLFDDPIGWIILGAAAVLEVLAVVLIRRIMAVDI